MVLEILELENSSMIWDLDNLVKKKQNKNPILLDQVCPVALS